MFYLQAISDAQSCLDNRVNSLDCPTLTEKFLPYCRGSKVLIKRVENISKVKSSAQLGFNLLVKIRNESGSRLWLSVQRGEES